MPTPYSLPSPRRSLSSPSLRRKKHHTLRVGDYALLNTQQGSSKSLGHEMITPRKSNLRPSTTSSLTSTPSPPFPLLNAHGHCPFLAEYLGTSGPFVYELILIAGVHWDRDEVYYTWEGGEGGGEELTKIGHESDPAQDLDEPLTPLTCALAHSQSNSPSDLLRLLKLPTTLAKPPSHFSNITSSFNKLRKFRSPTLHKFSLKIKSHASNLTSGKSLNLTVTPLHFIVASSLFIFLIDPLTLLLPPSSDNIILVFYTLAFIVLSIELVLEFYRRPSNYSALISGRYRYFPHVATYMNNIYAVVEAFALLFSLFEILVAYNAMNLGRFVPVWNDNPYDLNVEADVELNIANLSYLGYLVSEVSSDQIIGWAYLGWSYLRSVGIMRRLRVRWVREIEAQDSHGRKAVEKQIDAANKLPPPKRPTSSLDSSVYKSKPAPTFSPPPRRRRLSDASSIGSAGSSGNESNNLLRRRANTASTVTIQTDDSATVASSASIRSASITKSSYSSKSSSSKPHNLLTALLVHNSHLVITTGLLLTIIVPLLSIIFNNTTPITVDIVSDLNRINNKYPAVTLSAADCASFETDLNTWFFSYLYPVGVPNSFTRSTRNDDPVEFLVSATVLPVRSCPNLQVGQLGTIAVSSCPPLFGAVGTRKMIADFDRCALVEIGSLDAVRIAPSRSNPYVNVLAGSNLRWTSTVATYFWGAQEQHASVHGPTFPVNQFFTTNEYSASVLFNYSSTLSYASIFNITGRVLFLLVMWASMLMLRGDADVLVIRPLTRLLSIVKYYVRNPLAPALKRKKKKSERREIVWWKFWRRCRRRRFEDEDDDETFETEALVEAIGKIAAMLKKCWGVAGAAIISESIAARECRSFQKDVGIFDPTSRGKSVYAIFAFIEINGFNSLISTLGEDILNVINSVAVVVHEEVKRWGHLNSGQCNKNLGASFLMVWKIGDQAKIEEEYAKAASSVFDAVEGGDDVSSPSTVAINPNGMKSPSNMNSSRNLLTPSSPLRSPILKITPTEIHLPSLPGISSFANRALVGVMKSYARLHRDKDCLRWATGEDGKRRELDISIGMCCGWAIEGAVGSSEKIDATYLSPSVNNASRIMAANSIYSTTILLHSSFVALLPPIPKSLVRKIDNVYLKGSAEQVAIFAMDCKGRGVPFFMNVKTNRVLERESLNLTEDIFFSDPDLKDVRRHVTEEFRNVFNKGVELYLSGVFEEAIDVLKKANNIMRSSHEAGGWDGEDEDKTYWNDGPSLELIRFMESNTKISNWTGARQLPKRG
ncbi:hypothetical protein TrLO_g9339 [Triparma laevis f. longispina]|uniref:Guanylate cyclase domain-containing protein n=1 Tax=Triparma laevis f. longispina TaxID=1714387 RepID=A0A9W6ZHL4_9STRA|nr:hypothetical protein TrLO_g9339 [Triparma laevis f. longispina]